MAKTATAASKKVTRFCPAGHTLTIVKVVPVKGRSHFEWRCFDSNGSMVECR